MGEPIQVRIDMDNSQCSNAIKGIKVQLERHIEGIAYMGGNGEYPQQAKDKKCISKMEREEDCGAHASKSIVMELPIPELDDYAPKLEEVPDEFNEKHTMPTPIQIQKLHLYSK